MKVCSEPGCPTLTRGSRCTTNQRAKERARGTRQQRGYNGNHDRLRAEWAPIVAAGTVRCANPTCGRPIRPGQAWDLGHTEDRTAYRGPEHAACNRSEGGRATHRA
ncbi:hypothetical protein AVP41_00153 [Microbacterium sp. TNHR37B]|nr:hypothetical protein AVP41_00153 [Microbacterium sp. TNHR37B]